MFSSAVLIGRILQPVLPRYASRTSTSTLNAASLLIPRLSSGQHKGECGRIGIVGGSLEYTGAPYYAAMTALRLGADLAHVFCSPPAANAIKSYSPEIIVHPLLSADFANDAALSGWIARMDSVVIGPGLGREKYLGEIIGMVVNVTREKGIPLVIDADGLYFVNSSPTILSGHPNCTITPNIVEFRRLIDALNIKTTNGKPTKESMSQICKQLGCQIILKDREDYIQCGDEVIMGTHPGSFRRCGGQGDLLSGAVAVFMHWHNISEDNKSTSRTVPLYAASSLVRESAALTFSVHGRSTTANDMIGQIANAARHLFLEW